MNLYEFGARIAILYIPLLLSLTIHEYAHGLVAKWMGDNTAEFRGRLTLNPITHMDFIGTFLLPLSLIYFSAPIIGWGVPVPVDERNLKNPKADMFWVAFAGPISNIILAVLSAFCYVIFATKLPVSQYSSGIEAVSIAMIKMNLVLAIFNLIPIHPLDGGKVLARFLPDSINQKMEEHQNVMGILLLVLIFTGLFSFIFAPIDPMTSFLINIAHFIIR